MSPDRRNCRKIRATIVKATDDSVRKPRTALMAALISVTEGSTFTLMWGEPSPERTVRRLLLVIAAGN